MDTSWDSDSRKVLLQRCVGLASLGIEPDVESIRQSRYALARYIDDTLHLTRDDVVLDLGSGPGHIAAHLAPWVQHVYCADISKDYLAMCAEEVAGLNVSCHLIPFADLSEFYERNITAIYASAVFLHFNTYDVCLYLEECWKLLSPGGRMWLDYKPASELSIHDARFRRHMELYKADRSKIVRLLHYHYPHLIEGIAQQIGFSTTRYGENCRPEKRALDNHHVLLLHKP